MRTYLCHPRLLACLAAMAVLAPVSSAVAQSDRDLRDENQRLTTEVKQLTRELDAAKGQIQSLQRQVESLRTALATLRRSSQPRSPAPLEEEALTIDESVPNASPRALLTALKASYDKTFADQDQGEPGTRERTIYLNTVDRWAASANRDFRTKITWHVRVLTVQTMRRGPEVKVQAVDPKTKTELGDPFVITLQRSVARRFEQLQQRDLADVLVLKGTLHPQVVFDPQRDVVGPFDNPRFIGPYAELSLTVDASSLLPPTDDGSEDGAAGNSGRSK
ncbi:MAG: hypothetical protein V3T84_14030 [Phycisphaerales bacterium]